MLEMLKRTLATVGLALAITPLGACAPESRAPVGGEEVRASSSVASLAEQFATARLVDLTHPFDEATIYWPTASGFELTEDAKGHTDAGFFYAANSFAAAEHGGTHVDAPIHFYEGADTVEQIPLRRLIGPAVVVDVGTSVEDNADYRIVIEDLQGWEQAHQRSLHDSIVLLKTGWGRYWPDRASYLGTAELGQDAVAKLHFPGLDPAAAQWLAEERSVRAVGIDTASIDFGQSNLFASHVELFRHDIPAFENVANLDQLPPHGFLLIALPMKIADGSGGPSRIVALVPEPAD